MTFHHALSKVTFAIKSVSGSGIDVYVNSIALKNIAMSGDFAFLNANTAIPYFTLTNNTTATGTSTNTLSTTQTITDTGTATTITGNMYLIPQSLTDWAYTNTSASELDGTYILIDGELGGNASYTGSIVVPITTTSWVPGTAYNYTITFGDTSGASGGGGYNPDATTGTGTDEKPDKILVPITVNVTVDAWVDNTDTGNDIVL